MSLSQDFRCGNHTKHADLPLQPGCYCAQIRNLDSKETNAEGETQYAHSLAQEYRLNLGLAEKRLSAF